MFMEGGPSQMDLFDPKPELAEVERQAAAADSMTKDLRLAFIKPNAAVLASPRTFKPHGQSGIEFSDYIPNIASCADDICLVRSMYTEAFNHHPGPVAAVHRQHAGRAPDHGRVGRCTASAANRRTCPGFVVLSSGRRHQRRSARTARAASCPPTIRARPFRSSGDPDPVSVATRRASRRETQRAGLDALRD